MNAAFLVTGFTGGFHAIIDYLSAHVLTCLVPAFFIAGAMSALLPKEAITAFLSSKTSKWTSYPLAVLAGLLLAVCSCTILPLFAGIRKKGAGLGPALAFLYTAPATNILAILFTGSVLGWSFAAARIVLSVTFAIIIGITIASLFPEEKGAIASIALKARKAIPARRLIMFFASLFAILIFGTWRFPIEIKIGGVILFTLLVIAEALCWFTRDEQKEWLLESWSFFKTIFPLLLIGIFLAGFLGALLPDNLLAAHFGGNTVFANLGATLFGVIMYFPTLVEVPMAQLFLSLGVAKGPLLAYLLADPVISLASILVVRKLIGNKRTIVYVGLIILFSTIAGLLYGGGYLWK